MTTFTCVEDQELDPYLICPICLDPCNVPVNHKNNCERLFCKACLSSTSKCPICIKRLLSSEVEMVNIKFIVNKLSEVKVKCDNCSQICSRRESNDHQCPSAKEIELEKKVQNLEEEVIQLKKELEKLANNVVIKNQKTCSYNFFYQHNIWHISCDSNVKLEDIPYNDSSGFEEFTYNRSKYGIYYKKILNSFLYLIFNQGIIMYKVLSANNHIWSQNKGKTTYGHITMIGEIKDNLILIPCNFGGIIFSMDSGEIIVEFNEKIYLQDVKSTFHYASKKIKCSSYQLKKHFPGLEISTS